MLNCAPIVLRTREQSQTQAGVDLATFYNNCINADNGVDTTDPLSSRKSVAPTMTSTPGIIPKRTPMKSSERRPEVVS